MTKMCTYRISFIFNGKNMLEYVTAPNTTLALNIVRQRYPGSSSFFWTQE